MLTRNSLFIVRGIVVSSPANSTKGNVIDGQHFKLHKGKKAHQSLSGHVA